MTIDATIRDLFEQNATRIADERCPAGTDAPSLRHAARAMRCYAANLVVAARHGKAHPADHHVYERAADIIDARADVAQSSDRLAVDLLAIADAELASR